MTKEQTMEAIEVMQAWVDGKAIEARGVNYDTKWTELIKTTPSWRFEHNEYRIKPEPRVVELWVHPEQEQVYRTYEVTPNGEYVNEVNGWTKKKFREVCNE